MGKQRPVEIEGGQRFVVLWSMCWTVQHQGRRYFEAERLVRTQKLQCLGIQICEGDFGCLNFIVWSFVDFSFVCWLVLPFDNAEMFSGSDFLDNYPVIALSASACLQTWNQNTSTGFVGRWNWTIKVFRLLKDVSMCQLETPGKCCLLLQPHSFRAQPSRHFRWRLC